MADAGFSELARDGDGRQVPVVLLVLALNLAERVALDAPVGVLGDVAQPGPLAEVVVVELKVELAVSRRRLRRSQCNSQNSRWQISTGQNTKNGAVWTFF